MKQPESDSKKNRVRSIFLRIAALFTGTAFLFSACEDNLEKIKAFNSLENLPLMEASHFQTLFTDSGQVTFLLKAPKLLSYETDGVSYTEFPEGIELIRYDEHQRIISSIKANYAKQFEKEDKWEAKNNVIATNAQGDTLKTEHLIWEEKVGRIHTEEFVRIIRTDQIITGIGFQSDQELQNWRIKNPRGTIYIDVQNNP
ncbi:MAG: LPS export ABC transporter periplasmic protein LptC [Mariniphaga sp.]|nr:LPS export ABC transporter periplasmic protein LptC [Mariniphaga sp.]MDD4227259.1 LPS export ABC transporter periplasmic protein LptC [Mariniphaga sp.]MDD4425184.1 LPS export ABC transporter periplasmic protein LptC [Mariniphaga sp.]